MPDRRAIVAAMLGGGLTAAWQLPSNAPLQRGKVMGRNVAPPILLPNPDQEGRATVEQTLARRRSIRDFEGSPMTLAEVGQLLWAAQGVNDPSDLRTVPSAGALYPLELYAITMASSHLAAGIYHYRPRSHAIELVVAGDFHVRFVAAALMQEWIAKSSLILVVAACHGRTVARYGDRGRRYVAIEAGHCAQNVYLQATALGLGSTEVGAFNDDAVARLILLPQDQEPVTSMVVGRPVTGHRE